jgi:hypothetical protein
LNNHAIVLCDFLWEGHHATYLKIFSEIIVGYGQKICIINPNIDLLSKWKDTLNSRDQSHVILVKINEPKRHFLYKKHTFYQLALLFRAKAILKKQERKNRITIDFVFFPWLDDIGSPIRKPFHLLFKHFFPYRWGGLLFQYSQAFHAFNNSSATFELLRLPSCTYIATLEEQCIPLLRNKFKEKTIVQYPDFASVAKTNNCEDTTITSIKTHAGCRTKICMLGTIDRRKGMMTLLDVINDMDKKKYYFIIAGKLYKNTFKKDEILRIQHFFNHPPENVRVIEGYVSDGLFDGLLQTCNIIYAVYWCFPYSSNLLTKAAIFKKPIIVSEKFLMGKRVAQYNIGKVVAEKDKSACIDAIEALTQTDNIAISNFIQYEKDHSISKLKTILHDFIKNIT